MQWIKDNNGNKASVGLFGSEEKAKAALATLKVCRGCINCSDCSDCSDCLRCSDCSRCSYCSDCSDCLRCSYCSDCSYCSYCSYCSDCSNKKNDDPVRVPKIENIHRTVYTVASAPGALDMTNCHTCQKTHCRAGWVVTLAGNAGRALERFHNTELAAALIYRESSPDLPVSMARFLDENDEALTDMKRMAELEAAAGSLD